MTPPSPEIIQQARQRNNVPADWPWAMCQNNCGDIVFYPPDTPDGVTLVCSIQCAKQLTDRLGRKRYT